MSDNRNRRRPFKPSSYNDEGDVREGAPSSQKDSLQRRRNAAISLNSFSSKKGHDRALLEFKKRKDEKFQKNAVLLREYQRAMKKGGYDAGKGASRKRDRDDDGGGGDIKEKSNDDDHQQSEVKSHKKRHKSDPLYQARKQAELKKQQQLEKLSQKEEKQQSESKKHQNRKVRSKKMMQRTRRGQPLMKNVIGDLLGKIKSDVGDAGEESD